MARIVRDHMTGRLQHESSGDPYGRRTSFCATGGTVKGTGVSTRPAFWTVADTLSSDPALDWDSTNKKLLLSGIPGLSALLIGAASPPFDFDGDLQIGREGTNASIDIDVFSSGSNNPIMAFRRARGTIASPSAVQADDLLAAITAQGWGGSNGFNVLGNCNITMQADETWTNTAQGCHFTFATTAVGAATARGILRIGANGNVGLLVGKIETYNAIATVKQGVVPEYAEVNTTALAADVGQTLLYAVPATGAGLYRVTAYVVVTQQATTTATMPKIQIDWTDADSSTAVGPFDVTNVSTAVNPAVGSNSFGQNVITGDTGTPAGSTIISAKASTNINYRTTGYASVGGTPMQFAIHLRVEAL